MTTQRVPVVLLLLYIIFSGVAYNFAQESISFLPNVTRCIGEEVQMICYLSSESLVFVVPTALISLNGSVPASVILFNGITSLGGVDLTRYTADTTGLTISTSRPGVRVTISDYQATDGSVLFGCAGLFPNGSASDVLISNYPQHLAAPPSPPVSLTADYCSGTVQLAWTPGTSDRDTEMYFLSLNGVLIASLDPVTSFNYSTTLQRDMEYTYSVVAMSCAGNSTETPATSISVGNPPSSPVLTLSQTDTSCSHLLISWSTPSSDRSVLTYSVYRDDTFLTNTTDNQYTDNTQLSISTEYEYSVVAISCAGTSTAGVKSVKLEYDISSFSASYNFTSGEALLSWVLSTETSLQAVNSMSYLILLNYTLTQGNGTESSQLLTDTFSQLSTDTSYNITNNITLPTLTGEGEISAEISVCLSLTEQCGQTVSGVVECNSYTVNNATPLSLHLSTIVLLWMSVYAVLHWM